MAPVLVGMCYNMYIYKLETYYCCKEKPDTDGSMVSISISLVAYSLCRDEYPLHLENWCKIETAVAVTITMKFWAPGL